MEDEIQSDENTKEYTRNSEFGMQERKSDSGKVWTVGFFQKFYF